MGKNLASFNNRMQVSSWLFLYGLCCSASHLTSYGTLDPLEDPVPINQTEPSSGLTELLLVEENDPTPSPASSPSSSTSPSGEPSPNNTFARTKVIPRRSDQILPIMEMLSMTPALSFGILSFVDPSYAGSGTMETFLSFLTANIFLIITSAVQLYFYRDDMSTGCLKCSYTMSICLLSVISTIFDLLFSSVEGVAAGFRSDRVSILFGLITATFFLALVKLITAFNL